jgi:TATA-box binding protein (TBP) (component of TFIID and TFIIIB)
MNGPVDTIEIQNVVASTGIGQELDLEALAADLPGADFNPDNFPGLVYRTQDPKAAALIFRSGKIVCTGAKSIDDVHEALDIIFDKLRGLSIPVEEDPEVTVQNIVSSAWMFSEPRRPSSGSNLPISSNTSRRNEMFDPKVLRTSSPGSANPLCVTPTSQ